MSQVFFAVKLLSDPGQQNGLYWETAEGEPPSRRPWCCGGGEEGYRAAVGGGVRHTTDTTTGFVCPVVPMAAAVPWNTSPMVSSQGVALLAPAEYRVSGVKSFMVNHEGSSTKGSG
jgi:hypothetical protein